VGAETARLDPDSRSAALAALARAELQVLVVGGGVVGAGVALDAATRGLSVGLVEARDFGAGTSSRSSKLIHGGLRYLEQLNFGLVREALAERSLLLGVIAPHLVRPVPFLFPLTHHLWERPYVGTGVTAYDVLGFSLGHSRGLPATASCHGAARSGSRPGSSARRSPAASPTGTRRWTTPVMCSR
jgi:glycerol-3-phosphate dehydrogenase